MNNPALPNFLIIGSQRCGTTWLKQNLMFHPQIFMASQKELHFFDKEENWRKGIAWYASHFERRTTEKAIGEATPSYLPRTDIHQRILSTLSSHTQYIASFRNPIDRAFSAYHMERASGRIAPNVIFEEALKSKPSLWQNGLYSQHLTEWFKVTDPAQTLILLYDDIHTAPQHLLQTVCTFLNVDPDFSFPLAQIRRAQQKKPRFTRLNQIVYAGGRSLRRIGLSGVVKKLRPRIMNAIVKHNRVEVTQKYEMTPAERQMLIEYYADEI